ncbi:unnamed protein product [Penicillium camemberti]|uniref:Str. FM013 n=1 Tax=Penicillium camemberti (strain FM 013) TaxID=1429867 RepID=A0A0G4PQV9_PENC3|nr:unnamed protein product [Penicillium camemberti]
MPSLSQWASEPHTADHTHWVDEPGQRGTWAILSTCILTINHPLLLVFCLSDLRQPSSLEILVALRGSMIYYSQ